MSLPVPGPDDPRWDAPVSLPRSDRDLAWEMAYEPSAWQAMLLDLDRPCYAFSVDGHIAMAQDGMPGAAEGRGHDLVAIVPPMPAQQLGDPAFRARYGLQYAYAAGAMANGIASVELVTALGRAGLLSSFGAAGLIPSRIEDAIHRIQQALPNGPYAFNLIHSPSEEALEQRAVDLYLKYGVTTVEASAFLDLTPHVVRYRAAGLTVDRGGEVAIGNRLIAKVSRREVASQFMRPAPERLLRMLVERGWITEQQARLAAQVPMADDITVEADSGGHTDNRPLVCLLPSILALRDEIQEELRYAQPLRVGAAGGIGTPAAVLGAFMMGAAYVVTGSVNQACVEAGTSAHTRHLLAEAGMADVMMAPAADMFEMGVKVQLLKRGTFFPLRAQKLYDLYQRYASLEELPVSDRTQLEQRFFQRSFDAVWQETVDYFAERDPDQIRRAEGNPKRKMALVFRWYLGLSSRWSNSGTPGREMDYQIWCGPAMGAFNDWARGSYLEQPGARHAADIADHLMRGAAYLYRVQQLQCQGVRVPPALHHYHPQPQPGGAAA